MMRVTTWIFLLSLALSGNALANPSVLDPQTAQALENLHDIQLPPPIGWWPLAFSWWILLLSVTSIVIGIAWYFIELKRRNAYRKQALQALAEIQAADATDAEKIQQINRLLKQVALTAYGRQQTAKLFGKQWIEFLHKTANYIQQPTHLEESFTAGYGAESSAPEELKICINYALKWIKGHHQ